MGAPGSVPTVASYPPMPREEEEEEEGAPLPAGAGAGAAGRAKEAEARGRRRAAYHAIAGEALMVPFLWPSWFWPLISSGGADLLLGPGEVDCLDTMGNMLPPASCFPRGSESAKMYVTHI